MQSRETRKSKLCLQKGLLNSINSFRLKLGHSCFKTPKLELWKTQSTEDDFWNSRWRPKTKLLQAQNLAVFKICLLICLYLGVASSLWVEKSLNNRSISNRSYEAFFSNKLIFLFCYYCHFKFSSKLSFKMIYNDA